MFDLVPAPEPFARLASEVGAVDALEVVEIAGERPDNLDAAFPGWSNSDLSAGRELVAPDIAEVRRASYLIRPDQIRSRSDWRDIVVLPLALEAVRHPELAEQLRALMHEISDRPGAFRGDAYPREGNDLEWDQAGRDTERRVARGETLRTIGSTFHVAEANGFIRGVAEAAVHDEAGPAAFGRAGVDASQHSLASLLAAPIHRRRLEHGTDAQFGEVAVINGQGASGKSTIAITQAVGMAAGVSLLGQAVHRPRRVLLVNQEESAGEVALKLRAALTHYAAAIPSDTVDRITVYGAGQLSALRFVQIDGRQERLNNQAFQLLGEIIENARAEIVYLDPWSMLAGGGLNDNTLMYAAIQGLKNIASNLGCAIVIVAHTRKSGTLENDGQEATLGAVAFTNAARIVKGVRPLTAAECAAIGVPYGREKNIRQIIDQKSNYTPLGDAQYIEIIGVQVPNADPPDYPENDWVGVATPFIAQPGGRVLPLAGLKDVLIQLARGANGGADPYSSAKQAAAARPTGQLSGPPPDSRYFGPAAAALLAKHITGAKPQHLEKAAKEALNDAIAHGWAEIDTFKIGGNSRKGIRVVWSATPWAGEQVPAGLYVR